MSTDQSHRQRANKRLLGSVIIVVMVVALAYAVNQTPELTLRVPWIGFVFYHFLTGSHIPPYISYEAFKNDSSWLKDGDVLVSIAAKSGTTWYDIF